MPKRNAVLTVLGLNVRRRREARKLTQEALAERAGLDPTYISGIERGVRNPSILSIARLAKALDTSVSALCNGVER
jgi:transcriptional regulator with XRE-family HTH domain